jgi:SWI/SNF-related matrix-associated actin-dependent regulator 1 of chromatin subfamily A
MLLTGTPVPNRPHEFFWPIKRLAPAIIDNMGWHRFCARFVEGFEDIMGFRATGVRHEQEMHNRLRGSGWMARRRKEDVLPQLPPKRYSLVVFPQGSKTAKIVEQEQQFDHRQIIEHGVPVGVAALPELRREMGEAKVPDCVDWIKDALDGGMEKLLVFAHHGSVIEALAEGLKAYKPAVIYGKTSMTQRQASVDAFQTDPEARVLIGSFTPMGIGWTLTAAHDVVFVEASWVPSDNEQAIDRAHRIGQEAESVNVYYLVISESLDAKILSESMKKERDIQKVLG